MLIYNTTTRSGIRREDVQRVSVVDDVTDDCKFSQQYFCSQCWRHQHENLLPPPHRSPIKCEQETENSTVICCMV